MATSGTLILNPQSVDNGTVSSGMQSTCGPLPSSTCYDAGNAWAFGRGAVTNSITLNWTVDNNGVLSVSHGGTTGGNWYVASVNGYNLEIDFSTDNTNWTNILHSFRNEWPTPARDYSHTVDNISRLLVGDLSTYTLTQSGYIRARMWTLRACPTCGGISGQDVWPNAFPNDAASSATAVPIYIEVDYRPGKIWNGLDWKSHNRSGGADNIYNGSTWREMKTTDGGSGTGDPPSIYNNGWKNQRKIGSE